MKKKVAVITGSSSGIGLGIAKEFAKAGYDLMMNGLETNGAEIAANIAQEFKVTVLFSGANMLHAEQVIQMIQETETAFGKIDVLINNAGIQYVAPIENFPAEKWNDIIGVNLTSAFYTTKAVFSGMKYRKFGRILNIASAHGLAASEYKSAYVASKHGIIGFSKVIALEGAPYGITCNAICPGYVRTPLVENQIKDQAKSHEIPEDEVIQKIMLHKQPIKDFISIESVSALCLFLTSEHGNLITGAAIPIDGGWNAQ